MIVVDVNIVASLFISGDRTHQAKRVAERDPAWRLPTLWLHEFTNVLATCVRSGHTRLETVAGILSTAVQQFSRCQSSRPAEITLRIACGRNITAYNATYLALAEQSGVPCITEDRRLRGAAPQRAIGMEEFLAA